MAKYCIFGSSPRFGSRDEIIGERHRKLACFKSLRTARKKAAQLGAKYGPPEGFSDDVRVTLCRGATFCGRRGPVASTRKDRRHRASGRAARREQLQKDYIPF